MRLTSLLLLCSWSAACERGRCGEGTVDMGRACEAVLQCGPGTTQRGDSCWSLATQWVNLPYPEGNKTVVTQGNHGYYSHYYYDTYAVDFDLDTGSEVAAAREGVVLALREDSDSGCPNSSCADQANYLVIDHGDGSFASYLHLQQDGVLVEAGDIVGRGEVVALSGNTGFSSGPHLHFSVSDPFGQTLPLAFEELLDESEGVAYAGGAFTSQNAPQDPPASAPFSDCPSDLFLFMGVEVEAGVPCARVSPGERSVLRGRVLMPEAQLQVAAWSDVLQDWTYSCFPTEADGSFEVEQLWSEDTFSAFAYLMLAAADEDCYSYQSWAESVPLQVW